MLSKHPFQIITTLFVVSEKKPSSKAVCISCHANNINFIFLLYIFTSFLTSKACIYNLFVMRQIPKQKICMVVLLLYFFTSSLTLWWYLKVFYVIVFVCNILLLSADTYILHSTPYAGYLIMKCFPLHCLFNDLNFKVFFCTAKLYAKL